MNILQHFERHVLTLRAQAHFFSNIFLPPGRPPESSFLASALPPGRPPESPFSASAFPRDVRPIVDCVHGGELCMIT